MNRKTPLFHGSERCPDLERSSPKRSELSLHGDTVSGSVGFQIFVHSTAECQLWPLWRVPNLFAQFWE